MEEPTPGLFDELATVDVTGGMMLGAVMAGMLTLFAVLIATVVILVRLFIMPHSFASDVAEIGPGLLWVAGGYLVGFTVAGALLGVVNRLGFGLLRIPLSAFVLGASIYGGVGIAMHYFDSDHPSFRFIAIFSAIIGGLWAAGATVALLLKRRLRR